MTNKHPSLFSPFMLTEKIKLRNRIVMAPMTTWSANPDGTISEQELEFYKRRSQNVGLVITGCTYVTPSGIGFTHEFAAYDDRFINSLEKLAAAAKSGGAPAILQIFHAGNKAIPELVPNNDVISASASSVKSGDFMKRVVQSREMTENEIQETIRAFGDVTKRAIKAGFDGIELHGAHGFLLQNFFSPLFNQRNDRWGGDLEGRMRFPLAVLQEVKNVVYEYATKPFAIGYRISPEESATGGLRIEDTYKLLDRLISSGISYIHTSLVSINDSYPVESPNGPRTIELILNHIAGRVPVIAAGKIRTPSQAQEAISTGLPLVAIGKGLVINPEWVTLAESGRGHEIQTTLNPQLVPELTIPDKLWDQIQASKGTGWFPLMD
ncbi:NADH-dependent flavin oxidoreductase [Escherichia coli]|uniref:NADH-dependent flavin oxidoreductase n=12 Tax=Enterobacteriaceae TaxID=543 RepID=A0A0K6CU11_ECOLX|nr:NADH-dependent flavin oxidoreductase [Escherichia coli]NP_308358.1 NADH-dependent flavin oxidoreductase [Escherichia coli O157:H7 str. Sakai]EET3379650.1 NADH-dependent flavin oxidoreductase [Escherichia coli O111]EET3530114.1 NADH-dependent flavin oxidoreductase [Escherichia coli O157:NM]EFW4745348.1 NADH-dependent flavin oxidoreductase [Shigella sonnei]EFW8301430.1 NADH-dependent flavin oxidoreductase [Shigella flexneri]EHU78303.1 flavin oxidoreductase / NADH oxidase family protein [Esch